MPSRSASRPPARDETRCPLGEGDVAEPPLEVVPVALRQHEPVAVRRLAPQTGDVVVLPQRDRGARRRNAAGRTGRLARQLAAGRRTARPARRQHPAGAPAAGRGTGPGPPRAPWPAWPPGSWPATSRPRSARSPADGGQRGQVAFPVVARVAPGRRGRTPSLGRSHPGHRLLEGPGPAGQGDREGAAPEPRGGASPANAARRPRRGQVEDEVPGPPGGEGEVGADIPSRRSIVSTVAPGRRHQPVDESGPVCRVTSAMRGRHAGQAVEGEVDGRRTRSA